MREKIISFLISILMVPFLSLSISSGDALQAQTPIYDRDPVIIEEITGIKKPEESIVVEEELIVEEKPEILDKEIEEEFTEDPIGISLNGAEVTDEQIELIAIVTMAEAEGECEEGKRLVIDTILNRVDSDIWPNTIEEVIYQPSQFSCMWNGRVNRCYVMDDICQLVREELESRTNYDVVYFTAGGYGLYGEPLFQVGNHFFCSYD